jgi:type I restriction enzyme S subunit
MFSATPYGSWMKANLGEIAEFRQGLQVSVDKQTTTQLAGHVRFIRISDYVSKCEQRFILDPGPAYFCEEDDVVMVRYGDTGLVGRGIRGVIANNLFRVSPSTPDVTKSYLYWYLKQQNVYEFLKAVTTSAGLPAINHRMVAQIEVFYPPLVAQNAMTQILDQLEGKIALNHKMNETLETMASALFLNWLDDANPGSEVVLNIPKDGLLRNTGVESETSMTKPS